MGERLLKPELLNVLKIKTLICDTAGKEIKNDLPDQEEM